MLKHLVIVLLVASGQPRLAIAELSVYTSTGQLLQWCELYAMSMNEYSDLYAVAPDNLCTNFITGITDAHQGLVADGHIESLWCGPGGVSKDALARRVVRYMQDNRESLRTDAARTVMDAVRDAYPCE